MPDTAVVRLDELPFLLTMEHLQDLTGLSRPSAYKLVHTPGFPVVRLGRSMRVPRDAFLRWIDAQNETQDEDVLAHK